MTTHQFQPNLYYTAMGSYEPVLHIQPGDRVITTTVDASGRDASGEEITPPGNPMTGPFSIEGAERGDMLVMHLEKITPNRPSGWSSLSLAPNVVDPQYVPNLYHLPEDQPRQHALWEIDTHQGTAALRTPELKRRSLSLPLAPMLGCFGVAPERGQRISTATSGPYGGNMDYRGFKSGVTVFFPVFSPGALLFLGDGHAVQGDGEISGTGIEISMQVEFSVDLLKNKNIQWPHGEDENYIFTVGNARPLDQALQHATTEMARWLQTDYGLDAVTAGIILGQTVQYEVGNIFDPAFTMVCKMPKNVL